MSGWNSDPRKRQWLVTAARMVELFMAILSFLALPWILAAWLIVFIFDKVKR